jgi:hypothetical protein
MAKRCSLDELIRTSHRNFVRKEEKKEDQYGPFSNLLRITVLSRKHQKYSRHRRSERGEQGITTAGISPRVFGWSNIGCALSAQARSPAWTLPRASAVAGKRHSRALASGANVRSRRPDMRSGHDEPAHGTALTRPALCARPALHTTRCRRARRDHCECLGSASARPARVAYD